jgi:hypothetical protein
MKLRESGRPAEAYRETLLNVESILDHLGVDSRLGSEVAIGSET